MSTATRDKVDPKRLAYRLIAAVINGKATEFGKAIHNRYGAQGLLESSIQAFQEARRDDEVRHHTVESAVDAYLVRMKEFHAKFKPPMQDYEPEARQHLIDLVTIYNVITSPSALMSNDIVVTPEELIKHLEACV